MQMECALPVMKTQHPQCPIEARDHGVTGPMTVEVHGPTYPGSAAFVEAATASGLQLRDYNSATGRRVVCGADGAPLVLERAAASLPRQLALAFRLVSGKKHMWNTEIQQDIDGKAVLLSWVQAL